MHDSNDEPTPAREPDETLTEGDERFLRETLAEVSADYAKGMLKEAFDQVDWSAMADPTDLGRSLEALLAYYNAHGVRTTSFATASRWPSGNVNCPFIMFPELSSLETALELTEALARRAGSDDIVESIRCHLSSELQVQEGEAALAAGGWLALRGAVVSADSTWAVEIDNFEEAWRFVFRMPVSYAADLEAAAAAESANS